ncbi:GNAT family N-acetyltransferase [Massilia sp. MS-15]|uniref:GNAT family N-acetyltransferase n=1 Tax=Massilia sp. MS-15 TaxID=2878200 RepID=UPI001CD2241C|nr:GNAT family N-acetyltransferase [Massilia sp. MS-15]MCA1248032.1 GNAT family N-acetyltransferase [Massilia sp. MS-15]
MRIRAANNGDADSIVELIGQLGYANEAGQVREQLRALRVPASGEAFVAEDEGRVLGLAVVHTIKPLHVPARWALLSALVVDAGGRSAGVGARLLAAAERYAVTQGCAQIELSSNSARTRAHGFYERHGYQEKRRRFVKQLASIASPAA